MKRFLQCLTALAVLGVMPTMAQTKMVVLTDTHVMAPELLVSDGTAWQTVLANDRKLVDYSTQLFDKALTIIKDDIRPDIVLMTGDLTKDGEVLSHRYVADRLRTLLSAGIKVLVIPGNHDWGTSNAKYYDGETSWDAEKPTMAQLAEIYAPYGYEDCEREATTLTWAREPVEGLVLIGIDSGKDGKLSETTLTWICDKAEQAYSVGKQVIALMHHPLIPHFYGVDLFTGSAVVANYETIRNRLADAGVRVVLTGHFHTSDVAKDFNGDLTKEIIDINTGSLITYPCNYRVLTLDDDMSHLSMTTESIDEIISGDGFANTAKERLKGAIEKQIKARGTAYDIIAPKIAEAFIIHTEGDEHKSVKGASVLSELLSMAAMAKMLGVISADTITSMEVMGNSMLRDISQYQVEGRQNQTDDLTLNITLPERTENIIMPDYGYATYCTNRRIDFSQTAGIQAFMVTNITETAVSIQEVNVVPANTGVILSGNSGNYTLHATDKDANNMTANLLYGTLATTEAPTNSYVLAHENGRAGFFRAETGLLIPANKAYLTTGTRAARCLDINRVTAGVQIINNINLYSVPALYNLQGQRVNNLQKGIMIAEGKKIIVK